MPSYVLKQSEYALKLVCWSVLDHKFALWANVGVFILI